MCQYGLGNRPSLNTCTARPQSRDEFGIRLVYPTGKRGEAMLVLRTDLTDLEDCIASIVVCSKLTGTYMALLHFAMLPMRLSNREQGRCGCWIAGVSLQDLGSVSQDPDRRILSGVLFLTLFLHLPHPGASGQPLSRLARLHQNKYFAAAA